MKGLIEGRNNQVRGAHLKVAKRSGEVQRPVSRPSKIKGKEGNVNSDILNKDNLNKDSGYNINTSNRLKREAAIIGESKRKYTSDAK